MATPEATTPAPVMNGNVIDGKAVAALIRLEVAADVADIKAKFGRVRDHVVCPFLTRG